MAWGFKRILKGFNRPFKSPAAKAKLALFKKEVEHKREAYTNILLDIRLLAGSKAVSVSTLIQRQSS